MTTKVTKLCRLIQLSQLLQVEKNMNSQSLAERLGVSRRTLFRDIRELREAGISIEIDHATQGYRLANAWPIGRPEFTPEEFGSLYALSKSLGVSGDKFPLAEKALAGVLKIVNVLPLRTIELVSEYARVFAVECEGQVLDGETKSLLAQLVQLALTKHAVRVQFRVCSPDHRSTSILMPYGVAFCNQCWHVVGCSSLDSSVVHFPVDCIQSLEPLQRKFRVTPHFDLQKYAQRNISASAVTDEEK